MRIGARRRERTSSTIIDTTHCRHLNSMRWQRGSVWYCVSGANSFHASHALPHFPPPLFHSEFRRDASFLFLTHLCGQSRAKRRGHSSIWNLDMSAGGLANLTMITVAFDWPKGCFPPGIVPWGVTASLGCWRELAVEAGGFDLAYAKAGGGEDVAFASPGSF